jgi:hypothetical protein
LDPKFIRDENTLVTYSIVPFNNVSVLNDANLIKWQADKKDLSEVWSRMYAMSRLSNGRGLYVYTGDSIDSNLFEQSGNSNVSDRSFIYEDKVGAGLPIAPDALNYTYQIYNSIAGNGVHTLFGIEFALPEVSDNFKFTSLYIGLNARLALRLTNTAGLAHNGTTDIRFVYRKKDGAAKSIANFKMTNGYRHINTIPPQYYTTFSPQTAALDNLNDYSFYKDWQEQQPDGDSIARLTGYKKIKVDISTLEQYRDIEKIGLFIDCYLADNENIRDIYDIFEACLIFEHESNIEEAFV